MACAFVFALTVVNGLCCPISLANGEPVSDLLFFVALFALYFLPLIVACLRGMSGHGGVAVLNLFLGWTVLGWIIALAWAAGGRTD